MTMSVDELGIGAKDDIVTVSNCLLCRLNIIIQLHWPSLISKYRRTMGHWTLDIVERV